MTDHRIVCVEKDRGHIVAVGIGVTPEKATVRMTVAEVRKALADGNAFHTVSPSTGKKAYVEAFDGIRTKADHLKDDNLDEYRICAGTNWKR
jgi:hypothetical protein